MIITLIIIIIIIIIIYLFKIDNINTKLSCLDIIANSNNKDMVISVYNEDINWIHNEINNSEAGAVDTMHTVNTNPVVATMLLPL